MTAPLDAFVAGQYYTFYTPPNSLPAGFINSPGFNPNGSSSYNYADLTGALRPAGSLGVPSWVGATARGFTLTTTMSAELVEGDIWGGSVVEVIYRGGNMYLTWDAIAFRYGSIIPYWPWGTLGQIGTVGRLGSYYGGAVVMVAAPGTTAANFPAVGQVSLTGLTAPNAILAENNQADLLFDSRLRKVPVRLRLLPYFDQLVTYTGASAFTAGAGFIDGTGSQAVVVGTSPVPSPPAAGIRIAQAASYKWYSIL